MTDRQCTACPEGLTTASANATACAALPVDLEAGNSHTCARLTDGTVRCWGSNASGQLGDYTTYGWHSATPTVVWGLSNVVQVTAGFAAGADHSCARMLDRSVVCWGLNESGALGDGTTVTRFSRTPVIW